MNVFFLLLKGCVLHVTGPSPFPPLNKHIYKHTNKHRKGKAMEPKRQVAAEKEHSKASETAEKMYQTKQKDGGGEK